MEERWLPVGEIAAHLGVNPGTIHNWIDRKKCPPANPYAGGNSPNRSSTSGLRMVSRGSAVT